MGEGRDGPVSRHFSRVDIGAFFTALACGLALQVVSDLYVAMVLAPILLGCFIWLGNAAERAHKQVTAEREAAALAAARADEEHAAALRSLYEGIGELEYRLYGRVLSTRLDGVTPVPARRVPAARPEGQ